MVHLGRIYPVRLGDRIGEVPDRFEDVPDSTTM
jgi:hypothetical protein